MADQPGSFVSDDSVAVDVYPLGSLGVYMVLEQDLIALQEASSRAQTAQAFFWACLGSGLSAALGYLAASEMKPRIEGIYLAVTVALFVLALWFGFQWRRSATARKTTFDAIKARSAPSRRLMLAPVPTAAPALIDGKK
jgi:ABC-type branched-subunit amino acid transport system permease subunit